MRPFFFIALICFSVWAETAFSQPTITSVVGDIEDGGSLTISGSGFGGKSPAHPMLWDYFDGGQLWGEPFTREDLSNFDPLGSQYRDGEPVWYGTSTPSGGYLTNVGSYKGTWSAFNRLVGSNHENYGTEPAGGAFNRSDWRFWSATQDTIYYTYLVRTTRDGGTLGGQKFGRVGGWPQSPGSGVRGYNGPGCIICTGTAVSYNNGLTGGLGREDGMGPSSDWKRHEMYKVNSTPGIADGAWRAGQAWTPGGVTTTSDVLTRASEFSFRHESVQLPLSYVSEGKDISYMDVQMWADCVYVDNTQARVEIGNASTFSACTKKDIQIPSAWSSTSITVELNGASFSLDDEAYLYVVDASGEVNVVGYLITWGGESHGGDFGAPAPGPVSGGFISALSYGAQDGAEYYTVWVIEQGDTVPRRAGVSYGLLISDIPTSTETGTVYVTAHDAQGALLATSQAAAYGGDPD